MNDLLETEKRLTRIETLLEGIDERLRKMEANLKAVDDDYQKMKNRGAGLLVGIGLFAGAVGANIDKIMARLFGQ